MTSSLPKNAKIVNKYLAARLDGSPHELYSAAAHLIVNGGKRLRPYLVIKSCQMLGGSASDTLPAGAAIEMVHNFTLVHDDIMDNDEMRHGVPTVHTKFGMPLAILAGDVLFSKAFEIISIDNVKDKNMSSRLVARLAKACVDVCEGQVLDIRMAEGKKIPTKSEYIRMVEKKTSALFEVSCAMGAICAMGSEKDILNLASFGKNLGVAFQITDDYIGVLGDPKITKKPVGNDLREGKKSLPILLAIQKADKRSKKMILDVFGNTKATKKQINDAVNAMRSLEIEKDVRKEALRYADMAIRSLAPYSGAAKKELVSLLDFVVKRSL
ncbi:MAG TPA: polyprenyl synthetase family protein [Candidatus Nitrosotenuis sp.]|nr:polyprenyl synthetase family protein [Candidatus Nitrosotenuis sp.]